MRILSDAKIAETRDGTAMKRSWGGVWGRTIKKKK
jgi:hypothetical protein